MEWGFFGILNNGILKNNLSSKRKTVTVLPWYANVGEFYEKECMALLWEKTIDVCVICFRTFRHCILYV